MKINKLSQNVFYIEPEETPFASTSSSLLITSSSTIVIDLNLGNEDTKKILDEYNPDIALLSHYHLDHSLGAPVIENNKKTQLFIPEDEAEYLTSLDHFVGNTCGPYEFSKQFKEIVKNFLKYREIRNFKTFDDNEIFKSKDLTVKTVKVPGHSPGHTAFHIQEEKILFTSDMGIGPWGPWYGWIDSNIPLYMESLLRLKTFKDAHLVTCHDGIFPHDSDHLWQNAIDTIFEREEFILQRLEQGIRKEDIAEEGIYFKKKSSKSGPLKSLLTVQDEIMVEHHLDVIDNGGLSKLFPEYEKVKV